ETEILALRAWLAARRGDRAAERRELTALVERDPGATHAWERLATLAWERGEVEEARRLRLRKAEIDNTQDACRKQLLLGRDDLAVHAEDLAKLTRALGRRFEARGWSLIHERRSGRGP